MPPSRTVGFFLEKCSVPRLVASSLKNSDKWCKWEGRQQQQQKQREQREEGQEEQE